MAEALVADNGGEQRWGAPRQVQKLGARVSQAGPSEEILRHIGLNLLPHAPFPENLAALVYARQRLSGQRPLVFQPLGGLNPRLQFD